MASIRLDKLRKQFKEVLAVEGLSPGHRRRHVCRVPGSLRLRQDDHDEHDRRAGTAHVGRPLLRRKAHERRARRQTRRGLRLSELRHLHAHDGVRERRLRAEGARLPRSGDEARGQQDRRAAPADAHAGLERGSAQHQRHAEGRARPQHDHQSRDLPARRAVLQPGRLFPRVYRAASSSASSARSSRR